LHEGTPDVLRIHSPRFSSTQLTGWTPGPNDDAFVQVPAAIHPLYLYRISKQEKIAIIIVLSFMMRFFKIDPLRNNATIIPNV
jgi:hypothetical protein